MSAGQPAVKSRAFMPNVGDILTIETPNSRGMRGCSSASFFSSMSIDAGKVYLPTAIGESFLAHLLKLALLLSKPL